MALPTRPPTLVAELELARPIGDQMSAWAVGPDDLAASVLVRLHGEPLGMLEVPDLRAVSAAQVASHVRAGFAGRVERPLAVDGRLGGVRAAGRDQGCPQAVSTRVAQLPPASVVVPTCAGREELVRSVRSVLDVDYPSFEVLVVDNRPGTSGAAESVRTHFGGDARVRLVQEWKRGLSAARNRGLYSAEGDVVAFTDDDVVVDREWLARLVIALVDQHADCATGLILPSELRTPAQLLREELGGFGKGFDARVFGPAGVPGNPLYPYSPGLFGSGASAAFWRDALLAFGGFDEALGAGSPALGGEDLDIYLSFVLAGRRLVYEPRAVLWHRHHPGEQEFRQQVLHYGVGLAAFLTKRFLTSAEERRAILRRVPAGLRLLARPRDGAAPARAVVVVGGAGDGDRAARTVPRSLTVLQVAGMAYGPVAYLRSRRHERSAHGDRAGSAPTRAATPGPAPARHDPS